MSHFTALFDACVLYPAHLRDLLVRLAMTGRFRAKWTDRINEEWVSNVHESRGIPREKLERVRDLLNGAVRDCLVVGYEPLVAGLELPDPDDVHVLAAAITAGADVIVTYNLKDFPADVLAPFGIEAQHPDEFIAHLLDLHPSDVCSAVKSMRAVFENPPVEVDELLEFFETCELVQTGAVLRRYEDLL